MSNGNKNMKQQNPLEAMMGLQGNVKGETTAPNNQLPSENMPTQGGSHPLKDKAQGAQSILDSLISQYDLQSGDPEQQQKMFSEMIDELGPEILKNFVKVLKQTGMPIDERMLQGSLPTN